MQRVQKMKKIVQTRNFLHQKNLSFFNSPVGCQQAKTEKKTILEKLAVLMMILKHQGNSTNHLSKQAGASPINFFNFFGWLVYDSAKD